MGEGRERESERVSERERVGEGSIYKKAVAQL